MARPRPPQVEISAHTSVIRWDEFKNELLIKNGQQAVSLEPNQARWIAKTIQYLLGDDIE